MGCTAHSVGTDTGGLDQRMTQIAGNERFLQLLDEHTRILYKVANAYCANVEDRRDLVQEMVIHLWQSFPRFDDRFKFSTWMYRIALNVAISFLRSEGRRTRRTVALEQLDVIDFTAADRAMGEAGDDLRLLQQFVSRLDEMSRALVVLYLEGYSHAEIAEILGISTTNVGTRIGRIKARLQEDFSAA